MKASRDSAKAWRSLADAPVRTSLRYEAAVGITRLEAADAAAAEALVLGHLQGG